MEKKPVIYPTPPILNSEGKDSRKCPAHNFWMRKGQCEMCRLTADRKQQQQDKEAGIVKLPVKIGKL
jgi:hypothetical protein